MKTDSLTHRRVLQISLPIVLSNATVPILGAVDTGVVGQMGEAAPIGAVGIGAIILTAFYWIFGFLRMGTAGLAAQAHGAGDQPEVAALLSRALLIGATAGFAMILLQIPLFYGAFNLSPASPEVESLAREYMAIRVWSAPATIALYGITGWLVALERTKAILAIQVLMNGANIVLDLVFVLGFDWGVAGVGWATFIAEWAGLALGLWLCRDAFKGTAWRNAERIFDRIRLKNMAAVNTDIMIRSVLLQAIFVSFLFWGADFGDVNLAANQVLLQFLYITSYAQDGFAFAAESLVGQALGAKKRAALRRAAILTFGWGAATGLLCDLRTCDHRYHGQSARGPIGGPYFPAIYDCSPFGGGRVVDVGRDFYRGHTNQRHAQYDDHFGFGLFRLCVSIDGRVWKPRLMAWAIVKFCGAGHHTGHEIPRTGSVS